MTVSVAAERTSWAEHAECAELWGCFAVPPAIAAQVPAAEPGHRVPLTDAAGQHWGFVACPGTCTDADYDQWHLPGGDAAVRWRPDGTLTLSRSARGMHTLYYRRAGSAVHFASRLPRLLSVLRADEPRFEPRSLADVLALGRILPPLTMFAGVHHIEPASDLVWRAGAGGSLVAARLAHPDPAAADPACDDQEQPPTCPFGLPPDRIAGVARDAVSPFDIYDQLALGAAVIGQPVGGLAEAAVSALLAAGHMPPGGAWDVGTDLRADIAPHDETLLLRTLLRRRWRKRLLAYWAEERRPQLLAGAAEHRGLPAWRIMAERRLHLTALAAHHGHRARFVTGPDGAVEPTAVTPAATTAFASLAIGAIDLFHQRAEAGDFVWREAVKLAPFQVRHFVRSGTPVFRHQLQEAMAAILSMQYLWRFATVLPLPALAGTTSEDTSP